MSYFYVPRMYHDPGTFVELRRGGKWPQAQVTYAYLWGNNTGVEFGDGYFNEWGIAIASDACPTREDSYEKLVAEGQITDGGIGYKLRRIVAQRARNAREGILIAGELLDHFGYVTTGRTYIIADADEAWLLAVAMGKNWIARRVPDDEIVLLPNVHIIGVEADLTDTENVIASKGLVEYAVSRGWYDPAAGRPFSFREVYGAPPAAGSFMYEQGVDPRQWFSQELVIYQLRNWLPVEVGSVAWRLTAAPCGSVLVPWYSGITETPGPYRKDWDIEQALSIDFHFDPPEGTFNHDPENAFDVFKALELIMEDIDLARKFLTGYTGYRAMLALNMAKELVNHFKTIHWAN